MHPATGVVAIISERNNISTGFKSIIMTTGSGSLEVFLPGDIEFESTPIQGGGFGELFKGQHATKGVLALKRLRARVSGDPAQNERVRLCPSPCPFVDPC